MRADARRHHYIYKITRFDSKYYIGMHSTNNLDDGYFGSGKLITRSIKKYGVEKHSKEILEFLDSRVQLKARERELVNEEIIDDPLCMNLQLGGGGGFIDEEHRRKVILASAEARRGKKLSAEHVEKSTKHFDGSNYSKTSSRFAGKTHSAESKDKMSKAISAKCQGEKNSQFGSCWVVKDAKPVKIKKEQLDEYIRNGYSRGRKMPL